MEINKLLKAREENYGKFSNNAAISQRLRESAKCPAKSTG